MKTIKQQSTFVLLLGALLISTPALVSCHNEPSVMTDQDKETAKKEISDIAKGIIKDMEKLDPQSSIDLSLNSPDYLSINQDGTYCNYDKMKKQTLENYKHLAAIKSETTKEEFRFLTKDQVLYTWFGKMEVKLKTGEKYKRESNINTLLFNKIDNQWKVVYDQASTSSTIKIE